jgi:hypothetical protein
MTDADRKVAKFLVELLVLCEQQGIIRINREWLKHKGPST